VDHLIQYWQQPLNVLFRIYDFNQHRQVLREAQDVTGMQHTVSSEAGNSMEYGRACESFFSQSFQQRDREWLVVPLIGFAHEDSS